MEATSNNGTGLLYLTPIVVHFVHVNTVEGVWSHFKRSVIGSYINSLASIFKRILMN